MNPLPIAMDIVWKKRKKVKFLSVRLFATPWTMAYQALLSMGFSRQEYWSGLPFPSPRDLPDPGVDPGSPELQADSTVWTTRESVFHIAWNCSSNCTLPDSLVCFVHIHRRMTFNPWPGDPLPANGPFFPCSRITRRCTTTMTALATASACASG